MPKGQQTKEELIARVQEMEEFLTEIISELENKSKLGVLEFSILNGAKKILGRL